MCADGLNRLCVHVVILVAMVTVGLASPGIARGAAGVDCSWFVYQEEAQETFDLGGILAERLDEDGDGVACDGLSSRTSLAVPSHILASESDATMGVVEADDAISVVRDDTAEGGGLDVSTVRLFGIDPLVAFDEYDALPADCRRFLSRRSIGNALMVDDTTPLWLETGSTTGPSSGMWVWFRGNNDLGPYLLNEMLVREGSVRVTDDGAKSEYGSQLLAAQNAAKAAGDGFWGTCGHGLVQDDGRAVAAPESSSESTLTGAGDTVTEPIVVHGAPLKIDAEFGGNGNFVVWAVHPDGHRDLLFNEVGPYSGQTVLTSGQPGEVVFEIDAKASWQLKIRPAF